MLIFRKHCQIPRVKISYDTDISGIVKYSEEKDTANKTEEVSIVSRSDTIIQPPAMMIEATHTPIAGATVL